MAKMNQPPKQFVGAIATLMVPFYTLLTSTSSYAIVPAYAKITQILGPNNLSIRRGSEYGPAQIESVLRSTPEVLHLPGNNRVFAQLDFYNNSKQPLGLAVQTNTKNNDSTLYYFPCTFLQGNSSIVEWFNQNLGNRGCEKGIHIRSGQKLKLGAQLPTTFQSLKQELIAQESQPRFQFYCTVLANSGRGWMGVKSSGNPCDEPLQQCQASGGGECNAVTLDQWTVKDSDLTALVSCANNREFIEKGNGSTMNELVNKVWGQAQTKGATSCALRVIGSKDVIVLPLPSNERTLVQTSNSDDCIISEVSSGAATVRSAKKPEGVPLNSGKRYTYCGENTPDKLEGFDPANESVEMQVFRAPERGLKFCDREQVSGGQEINTRTIQLTAKEGEIRISYDMYGIPDRLEVKYEGRQLLDTGSVSGNNTVSIPFQGNSAQVEVTLTGNQQESGTEWRYTLFCPK
jgi:hypothetical protein